MSRRPTRCYVQKISVSVPRRPLGGASEAAVVHRTLRNVRRSNVYKENRAEIMCLPSYSEHYPTFDGGRWMQRSLITRTCAKSYEYDVSQRAKTFFGTGCTVESIDRSSLGQLTYTVALVKAARVINSYRSCRTDT